MPRFGWIEIWFAFHLWPGSHQLLTALRGIVKASLLLVFESSSGSWEDSIFVPSFGMLPVSKGLFNTTGIFIV